MARNTKTAAPAAAGPADKGLKIVSRSPSFRRAGREWTSEAQTVPLSELTEDQVDALRDEPELVVVDVDIPTEPDTPAA